MENIYESNPYETLTDVWFKCLFENEDTSDGYFDRFLNDDDDEEELITVRKSDVMKFMQMLEEMVNKDKKRKMVKRK